MYLTLISMHAAQKSRKNRVKNGHKIALNLLSWAYFSLFSEYQPKSLDTPSLLVWESVAVGYYEKTKNKTEILWICSSNLFM